jgi:hypothetical protein
MLTRTKYIICLLDITKETQSLSNREFSLRIELCEDTYKLAKIQEIKWKQRSAANWLAQGDKNIKYFYAFALGRRVMNHILRIVTATDNPHDQPNILT